LKMVSAGGAPKSVRASNSISMELIASEKAKV
jgi:hypothetical protein